MNKTPHTKGFTLIELIIVMVILGIMMTIGTSAFMSSQKKSRDSTRKSNLKAITVALELYYNDKGRYPADDAAGGIKGCGLDAAPTVCTENGVFSDSNGTIYMERIPTDPTPTRKYWYRQAATNQYQIYANLENDQDPAIITTAYNCNRSGAAIPCNFGLSSANIAP